MGTGDLLRFGHAPCVDGYSGTPLPGYPLCRSIIALPLANCTHGPIWSRQTLAYDGRAGLRTMGPHRSSAITHTIARRLIRVRERHNDEFGWPWLEECRGKRADRRRANKFLLGCILDYQIPADRAWENAARLAEQIFGDPQDLWHKITALSNRQWMRKFRQYGLHRLRQGHERVWRIAKRIVSIYQGDARRIWRDQPPGVALRRLEELGVGEAISRMVVGALVDTSQLSGVGDVKPDRHVCRVLGRVVRGAGFRPGETIAETRRIFPRNPWLLDRPLYLIGKKFCRPRRPDCTACYMRRVCVFHRITS